MCCSYICVIPADHDGKDVVLPFERVNNHITDVYKIVTANKIVAVRLIFLILKMQQQDQNPWGRFRRPARQDELEDKLLSIGLSQRDIRYLFASTEFLSLPCLNHQLIFFDNFYRKLFNRPCTTNQLSLVFDMNPRSVRRNLKNGLMEPKELGRHHALSNEIEQQLLNEIELRFKSNNSITQVQLIELIANRYSINVTRGWVNNFLCRRKDEIQKCKSYPQEDTRMAIPREYLEKHIQNLHEVVSGTCRELLFNLDEVGLGEWEDRKIFKVIVPKFADKNSVQHSYKRNSPHITMLVCCSCGGDALTPMIITKNPIPKKFHETGVRIEEDVIIE